jgi:hypothetical protein
MEKKCDHLVIFELIRANLPCHNTELGHLNQVHLHRMTNSLSPMDMGTSPMVSHQSSFNLISAMQYYQYFW